jgi:hypothetical protein
MDGVRDVSAAKIIAFEDCRLGLEEIDVSFTVVALDTSILCEEACAFTGTGRGASGLFVEACGVVGAGRSAVSLSEEAWGTAGARRGASGLLGEICVAGGVGRGGSGWREGNGALCDATEGDLVWLLDNGAAFRDGNSANPSEFENWTPLNEPENGDGAGGTGQGFVGTLLNCALLRIDQYVSHEGNDAAASGLEKRTPWKEPENGDGARGTGHRFENGDGAGEAGNGFENDDRVGEAGNRFENGDRVGGTGNGFENGDRAGGPDNGFENDDGAGGIGNGFENGDRAGGTGNGSENGDRAGGTGNGFVGALLDCAVLWIDPDGCAFESLEKSGDTVTEKPGGKTRSLKRFLGVLLESGRFSKRLVDSVDEPGELVGGWLTWLWTSWGAGILVKAFAVFEPLVSLDGKKSKMGGPWLNTPDFAVTTAALSLVWGVGKEGGVGLPKEPVFGSGFDTLGLVEGLVVGLSLTAVRGVLSVLFDAAWDGDISISPSSE